MEIFLSNPYLDRLAKRGTNGHGKTSERRVAKAMGAKPTPNSGSLRGAKSDAVLQDFRLEMKSTKNKTLPLELGWLVKITSEALPNNQVPAIVCSFVNLDGSPVSKTNAEWVLIPKWKFEEMLT